MCRKKISCKFSENSLGELQRHVLVDSSVLTTLTNTARATGRLVYAFSRTFSYDGYCLHT